MQNLTIDTILNDNTRFAIVDEDTVTVTTEQWEQCSEWFKAESAKRGETTGRGRLPLGDTLRAWHAAGMPVINSEEVRNMRLWVAETMGRETIDGIDWDSERVKNMVRQWEGMGKPEATRFLPKGVKAKFIGNVIVDGRITDEPRTVYVTAEALEAYREKNGITGKSSQDTYRGAVADELTDLAIRTLVTVGTTYTYDDDGKSLSGRKALESEVNSLREKAERQAAILAAIREATKAKDFARVAELSEQLED